MRLRFDPGPAPWCQSERRAGADARRRYKFAAEKPNRTKCPQPVSPFCRVPPRSSVLLRAAPSRSKPPRPVPRPLDRATKTPYIPDIRTDTTCHFLPAKLAAGPPSGGHFSFSLYESSPFGIHSIQTRHRKRANAWTEISPKHSLWSSATRADT